MNRDEHSGLPFGHRHGAVRWKFANEAQRLAFTLPASDGGALRNRTGAIGAELNASDIGSVAMQADDNSQWILVDISNYSNASGWKRIDGGASVAAVLTGAANTLALIHANTLLGVSHGSATSLTVPNIATVPFPIGTQIAVYQVGAGALTIVAGGGVTIRCARTLVFSEQYSVASLVKIAADEWLLTGDLVP